MATEQAAAASGGGDGGDDIGEMGAALESFFSDGLHRALHSFVVANKPKFIAPAGAEEHSHGNYELFQQFQSLVDTELIKHFEARSLSTEKLWQTVVSCHQSGESDLKPHLEFLLASTEYPRFLQMFAEYSGADELGGGEDELGGLEEDADPEWA